jgi:hypothetical protein
MCWTTSQILVVAGLVFEFFSVAITVRKVFWDINKLIKEQILHKSDSKYIITAKTDKPWVGQIAIVLLIIGMILQGLGVFF